MKLPRVRRTVRHLMIAVAAAGALLWGGAMWLRSAGFRARAESFAELAENVVRDANITATSRIPPAPA